MNASSSIAKIRTGLIVAAAALLASLHVEAAPPIQVTAADPTSAPQGTLSLDVTVSGSGFDSSAAVSFLVTGTTNPGGITVKNVKVTGPKKLVATIDVADAAAIANFDIQVTQSGGRKGKGTSLFAVLAKASNDPCAAANIDFPAFTFREQSAHGQQIYVSDAMGKCVRPVHDIIGLSSDAWSTVFSYPVAGTTDLGRIVWLQSNRHVYGVSFSVDGTSVTPYPMELVHEDLDGKIVAVDMSTDGSTAYAALEAPGSSSVIAINIGDHSYTTVYSSTDSVEKVTVDQSGVLFVRQSGPYPAPFQFLRIDPGCTDPSCAVVIAQDNVRDVDQIDYPAASLVDDRLVYQHSGLTTKGCPLLQIISKNGGPVLGTPRPIYGQRPSWYGGNVLTNGIKVSKRGCVISSTINQIDPQTGVETVLVRGFDADGR